MVKNQRLKPITEQAKRAWALLRQESNVDLECLTLEGSATRRRVRVDATVDGSAAGALSVMSQGELHALSLALFLPRAAMTESPFRFIVLDDPVQAMDPAKVDGLVELLSELAQTRQVIVLSHDDRLPAAARRSTVPVRIIEVTRGTESRVSLRTATDPTTRYLRDAEALTKDQGLPDSTLRQVLPGLLRIAVEAAARDAYFARQLAQGTAVHELERRWTDSRLTRDRVSLAVFDDVRPLDSWLRSPYRKMGLGIVTSGGHRDGLRSHVDPRDAVHDVRRLVNDVREGVKS